MEVGLNCEKSITRPVPVVGEVLALGLVLALGGTGKEGGNPGEV